jgi:hypothetical protein
LRGRIGQITAIQAKLFPSQIAILRPTARNLRRSVVNRKLMWAIGGGALLIASTALVIVMAEPIKGPVFIAGDQPVTEDQVRQKLQSDGWSNVQIVRDGRYLEAIASKNGQNSKVVVDSQTGRLRAGDDGDDED